MSTPEMILRILAAVGGGLIIGFEREWRQKSAGLRTNVLVSTGACFYVLLSILITGESGDDVTRIISQVVSGIGFLGAGIIFREGTNVHGLTTAATVWCSSAVGCMAGAGFWLLGVMATVTILLINSVLVAIDKLLEQKK